MVGVLVRMRSLRLVERCPLRPRSRRLRSETRVRAMRRSVSSWLSPGPRVPTPPSEALEVLPHAAHAREVVFELGELDLELALRTAGVLREDVEDELRAVDHACLQRVLERTLLRRRELVVHEQDLGPRFGIGALELAQFSLARRRCADRGGRAAA